MRLLSLQNLTLVTFFLLILPGCAKAAEECTLVTDGVIRVVPKDQLDPADVTRATCRKVKKLQKRRTKPKYRPSMPRFKRPKFNATTGKENRLSPDRVTLTGAQKEFSFQTPMGPLKIRWPVNSTPFFGREPYYLVKEAWIDATRTLARRPFPRSLRSAQFNWNMVFLDESSTRRAYPWASQDCHPAWIRPPANIFVSAYFIGTGCGRRKLPESRAREKLSGTLYHEFGHAVEYQLLGSAQRRSQRYHSEGFAMWFESLALSDHGLSRSAAIIRKDAKRYYTPEWVPARFNGSYPDYVRAFAMIETLVEKGDLRRLLKVYELMSKAGMRAPSFETAVEKVYGWDMQKWKGKTVQHISQSY